jgi:RimJ/RimL family protein N-acetyltransferase
VDLGDRHAARCFGSGRRTRLLDDALAAATAQQRELHKKVIEQRTHLAQREILAAAIDSQEHRYWVIEADTQVGIVKLSTQGRTPGRAALLYYVASAHRCQYHAPRAVALVVRHAFDELGVEALLADVLLANEPSAKLLERLGFGRTGDRQVAQSERGPEQLEEWRLERRNSPGESRDKPGLVSSSGSASESADAAAFPRL